ncbi:MAG: hypothetical protein K0R61_4993, partial [Microvirga sp.]|nr:hypothetical protein [Microvirga sp.]
MMINTSTVAHQGRWGVHSITARPKLKGALFIEPGRIVPDEKPIPSWDRL